MRRYTASQVTTELRAGLRVVGLIGYIYQRFECTGIAHGEVGENFAIHFHAGKFQTVHELIIRCAFFTRGGVDARNPEAAKFALAVMPVTVMVKEGMGQGFVRAAI